MMKYRNVVYGDTNIPVPAHLNFGKLLLDKIIEGKHNVALVNGATGEEVVFSSIAQDIVNLSISLRKLGVVKHDVVAICSENNFEWLVSMAAVICTGAIVTTISPSSTEGEILHMFSINKPKYIFCSETVLRRKHHFFKSMSFIKDIIVYGPARFDSTVRYVDLITNNIHIESFEPVDVQGQSDVAIILYSSGTTGLPKGVPLTHHNLIIACAQPHFSSTKFRTLCIAPWVNTAGLLNAISQLISNSMFIFLPRFEEELYLRTIQKYKVEVLATVPPVVVILAKSTIIDNYDMSSVKMMYCRAAHIDATVINAAKKRFKNLPYILQGYGMSEATGAITRESHESMQLNKPGSVGKVIPGIIVKIVDTETREILGPGKSGEVCIKGPVVFRGYLGKSTINDDFDDDGFFKTGDIAYYDEDGYFFIVDRLKELIKYKAWQVAPAELEAVLLQHEGVRDAGVIGIPDEMAGELPKAFVVKRGNVYVNEQELMDFVASKVSAYKQLRGGVTFIDEIPKVASGKILRRLLKERVKSKIVSKL